jgi:hypothetical protein
MSTEKVSSEKRILASRANGALSRGPKTPEGKARSARNAMRHGLLAKQVVLRNESSEGFQTLFDAYTERFGPLDDVEIGLIEEMVAAYWRMHRALAIEMHMLDSDMAGRQSPTAVGRLTDSFSSLADTPKFNAIQRYQARLHLVHSRALRELAAMRRTLPQQMLLPNEPRKSHAFNETVEDEPRFEPKFDSGNGEDLPTPGAEMPALEREPCETLE